MFQQGCVRTNVCDYVHRCTSSVTSLARSLGNYVAAGSVHKRESKSSRCQRNDDRVKHAVIVRMNVALPSTACRSVGLLGENLNRKSAVKLPGAYKYRSV